MRKKSLIQFVTVTLIAVVFTVLVKIVDVGFVSSTGSLVGFSSVNIPFSQKFGFNPILYKVSEVLGYLIFLVIAVFAFIGCYQLIKRKSLMKVDKDLYALAITYVFTFALYIFFDKVLVINLRPIIMAGESIAEPSFPSSHTLLAVSVLGTAISECGKIRKKSFRVSLVIVLAILMGATVLSRLFSGVHWVTDIIAGILWGEVMMTLYQLFSALFSKEEK